MARPIPDTSVVNGNISVRNISMEMEILEISERVSEILEILLILEIFKKYILNLF